MSMNKPQIKENLRERLMEGQIREAAGVLVKCTETNKILLVLRSSEVEEGCVWNLVSGGIDKGETTLEGLKREVNEELSVDPDIIEYKKINREYVHKKHMDFYYYEGFTKSEFIPTLDHENTDFGWFSKDDLPSPLYPKIITKINKIWEHQT